jgi:hypothetical protein
VARLGRRQTSWPLPGPWADAHAQADVLARQGAQQSAQGVQGVQGAQGAQGAQLLKLRQDAPDHRLPLFVGGELEGPVALSIPQVATGQRKGQRTPARFAQTALVEPLLEQMHFRFTPGAFESEQ